MGVFDFLMKKGPRLDINMAAEYLKEDPSAVLLDVREPDEYASGRIPGSWNMPLSILMAERAGLPDKEAPIYVYCLSGARSRQAARILKNQGYTNILDLGGINKYRGPVES